MREQLNPGTALVGFCGGPFTVAGYLVEGRPSREFAKTKALMYGAPEVWHALMEKLAEASARYVAAQVEAGADAVQLFDSWAGALSVEDYAEFAARYSARILGAVAAPTIHFATGATHLLRSLAAAGGDVIGLDWRLPLDDGWSRRRRRPRRAGQPRPGRPARPVGARGGRRRAPSSNVRAAGRATSSTWATASCPQTDPGRADPPHRARPGRDGRGARLATRWQPLYRDCPCKGGAPGGSSKAGQSL